MTDVARLALVRGIMCRLAIASHDEARAVDKILTRLEQLRFIWSRRIATSPHDVDSHFHLAAPIGDAVTTRCHGRWGLLDEYETSDAPPVMDRCLACQRAAWRETELDPLIAAVLELIAAEDRERATLREEARAEMFDAGGEG